MFRACVRTRLTHLCLASNYRLQTRRLTFKAIYSSFPASLSYYCPAATLNLFDHRDIDKYPDNPSEDQVVLSANGLVYPGICERFISNGAVLSPNTFTLQEDARRNFDWYLERHEEGDRDVQSPFIFTIPKGTTIPRNLILFNESTARFSLQPSQGIPLQELNLELDKFFRNYAIKDDAETWFKDHPYQSAVADEEEELWMIK